MEAVQQCYQGVTAVTKEYSSVTRGVTAVTKEYISVTRGVTAVTIECVGSGTAVLQGV